MGDRLAALLDTVLEGNAFQRARIGEARALGGVAADDEGGPARRPGGASALRHEPHVRARALHAPAPDERQPRARRCACSTPPRTGRGGGAASAACSRAAGVGAGRPWSRSRTRSGPTSSSGRPTRARSEVGAMVIALGGMDSVQRLETIREYGATTLVCTPSYARPPREGRRRAGARGGARSVDTLRLHRGARSVAARRCATEIEGVWDARCFDHAGLVRGRARSPTRAPSDGGLHLIEDEFADRDRRPRDRRAGRRRRARRAGR